MSTRLSTGGRLLDRSRSLRFSFDGHAAEGFAGDTLASALLASGRMLLGRSFKYHRPRGLLAAGVEEPNALVNLGEGERMEPNRRATSVPLRDGLVATSQNRWPSLETDVGAVNDALGRFLPAGFYYKTFMWPGAFWKSVYEPFIRRAAGLGRVPKGRDPDRYEHFYAHVDVLVAGGGVAGLAATLAAGRAGRRVLLMEQEGWWGGRAGVDAPEIDGMTAPAWIERTVAELRRMPNVRMRLRAQVAGIYDHGYAVAAEDLEALAPGRHEGPRQRLWRIRARRIVAATGAIERPLAFAGNDVPGVMLASAVRDYLANWAVSVGDRVVVVTNNDDAYRTALAVHRAGLVVPVIVDARPRPEGELVQRAREMGLRIEAGRGIAKVHGRKRVRGVTLCALAGEGSGLEDIACDAVAMSGGWSPAVHLWSHCGGKLLWDEAAALFRPDRDRPPRGADGEPMVLSAGSADGALRTADVLASGLLAGAEAAGSDEEPAPLAAHDAEEGPILPVWVMPQGASPELRRKMWLDFQNDVKVSDVELAAREGFIAVEHAKRYTTLGMATDQGKTSNINGLAVLSQSVQLPIPEVGTTTFRPPYTPLTLGAIAGVAKGDLFQPVRETPMHAWHAAHGAVWEPVGLWRRPWAYLREGEDRHAAALREVTAVRRQVGMLDASTLGKIVVKGPDAGRFLDMIYTGVMSTLPVGKCRYGLICSENGFLIDDGVVARLSEDAWLCHTTTGGAERIHAHMEDWLQCEWHDWRVFTANLTEQWAQIVVAGPRARAVLERLGGMDLSAAALPHMTWAEGMLAGLPVRVHRISFSGELSFEIAVPAASGLALWEAIREAGAPEGITPYGTEAMHILRAEKGYIMIGEETDGTVIPQDLNLGWAISRKKPDYIGKRAQERSHMASPLRWRLVGLETMNGSVLPEGAYILAPGQNAVGQRNTQGRVTSTYYSPTLARGIAMALLERGPERMDEVVEVARKGADPVLARVVDPVLYDKAGERLHG
ncbi:sarcosine oxidase subunit alpha family protein [Rubellimicrobium sp. CFH 75288]|uniref:sarcosine oxidase subunit alpha family protein n=1 Tax=Rubellimicrobium sp. CFH 75288 TaxID=2697034 RepID=UPI00141283F8|nr:sarcosine oxidase subunit alpha family protein [Rubellimicrobium sp. CFH 75288]NAZ36380.1 sarcosine oxidase subunit alpha family protein [Rubellimicrobium sp. CFH 75288]